MTPCRAIIAIGFLVAFVPPTDVAASLPIRTRNLGFEDGRVGEIPPGWAPNTNAGSFTAALSREHPHRGTGCLEIQRDTVRVVQLCAAYQMIDATPYRGRRVRLSGWIRFEPASSNDSSGSARLWIRSNGYPWSYDEGADHPVRSSPWTRAQVVCEVAQDASY